TSSVMPSEKYSSSLSRLMFTNGSTATEAALNALARSGVGRAPRRARKCHVTPGAAASRPIPTRSSVSRTPSNPAFRFGRTEGVRSIPIVAPVPNDQQKRIWNEVNAPRFFAIRDALERSLAPYGMAAIDALAPTPGNSALDVGCGFGSTARDLARRLGISGQVLGIDVS